MAQRYLGLWVRRRARTGWLRWVTIRRPVHMRWNRLLPQDTAAQKKRKLINEA